MDFSKSIDRFGEATVKQIDSEVRKVAFNLFRDIVYDSKVITGRFRGANQISIDEPINTTPLQIPKDANSVISRESSKLKAPIEGKDIYIQNNVVYSQRVENKHGTYRINLLRYKQGLNL